MKIRQLSWLGVLLLAAISPPLRAQEPPQKLTLGQALDLAAKQNLALLAAREQRAVALAGVRIAGERPNPSIAFAAYRDTPHESLLVDQPVELGPKRGDRIEVSRQESAVTETDIAALERQIRHSVRDAYFGLARARGASAQQADVLNLAERLRDIAQARFQAGDIPGIEVTQADLEVARTRADLQVAKQEEAVALSDLNALLDEPAATNWDPDGALATLPPPISLDDLLARAGVSSSEIARISQQEKVQQSQTALLKAERIPNLGLEFGSDFDAPHEFNVGPRGQVTVEVPIFSHNQGEIAQSQANERVLNGELAAARRASSAKVESAYLDLEARRTQARLYHDDVLPSSQHLEEMAEESYRAGKTNILTALTAQQQVQQAQRDYLDSLLAVQFAFATLEEAVGAPLD